MVLHILQRVVTLILIFLILLGIVFYFSEPLKYSPMIEIIELDNPQYEFYSANLGGYEDLEIELTRILAFHNLEFHMFNKEKSVNNPRIEEEITRGMESQEIVELRNEVALLSGDLHDYYFPRAFLSYAKGNYVAFLIVAAFVTIRAIIAEGRKRRKNTK